MTLGGSSTVWELDLKSHVVESENWMCRLSGLSFQTWTRTSASSGAVVLFGRVRRTDGPQVLSWTQTWGTSTPSSSRNVTDTMAMWAAHSPGPGGDQGPLHQHQVDKGNEVMILLSCKQHTLLPHSITGAPVHEGNTAPVVGSQVLVFLLWTDSTEGCEAIPPDQKLYL